MKDIMKTLFYSFKGNGEKGIIQPLMHQLSLMPLFFAFTIGSIVLSNVAPVCARLYINEFMADNKSVTKDPAGSYEDWIEIYNSGTSVVNMGGMYLTDNLANKTKWQIPANVEAPAEGYLLFWADDDVSEGDYHTNFKLDADGEEIGLFNADGTMVDSVVFGTQLVDVSYGRYPDGGTVWGFMEATPGAINSSTNAPPTITGTIHSPLTPDVDDIVWVTCKVNDDSAVAIVALTYDAGLGPVNELMFDDGEHNDGQSGDGLFSFEMPFFAKDAVVKYYITATDNLGAQFRDPATAPAKTHFYIVGYEPPQLFINEFMADNDSVVEDPDEPGSFEDWIEIYNPTGSSVNMGGMYLTDDANNPTKWQVPEGMPIQFGGYLLFWADNDEGQGDNHTNFKLSAEGGESISLYGADGVSLIDSINFSAQLTDVSYGRYPDGGSSWGFMEGTAGSANSLHNVPPLITGTINTPLLPDDNDLVWVTCTVSDDGEIDSVTLSYNSGSGPVNIAMSDDGKNNDGESGDGIFGAPIPFFANDTIVEYYIVAMDDDGVVVIDPVTAPVTVYCYIVGYVLPTVSINEFMADNKYTIEDPDDPNSYEDWIEIYNSGNNDVEMGGMYLSDDLSNPIKWRIPDGVTIQAGSYYLFWADNDEEQGLNHANFRLSKEGGEIGLFDIDARKNMPISTMTFMEQPTDCSWGKIFDGKEPWVLSENHTPGDANAFPLGTHVFIWTISPGSSSSRLVERNGGAISSLAQLHEDSGKRESSYFFWGEPAGDNFSIEPHQSFTISITSPCSFFF